jgi:hypothetical protein
MVNNSLTLGNIMAYQGIPGPFTDQTPFRDMHFSKWADNLPERKSATIKNYLESLGFVIGTDKLTEEENQRLQYAEDVWHRNSPWIRTPQAFNALFEIADESVCGSFSISSFSCKYWPKAQVLKALSDSGWIYDINPQTTYFEIVQGNRLYARYQQILGSRFIAIIKG